MFQGEYFAQKSGTGRYAESNAIRAPLTKGTPLGMVGAIIGYNPGQAEPSFSLAQGKKNGEPHEHRRERLRNYRQQYGRDEIYQEAMNAG